MKLSELNSVESEIVLRKFLFLGRLITETKMAPVVCKLFDTRAKSFFDTSIDSFGVLPSIYDALKKYGLSVILTSGSLVLLFPPISHGKLLCIAKFENLKLMRGIRLILTTLIYILRKLALKHITSQVLVYLFCEQFPDLVCCLHTQVRLMGSLGLNEGIPWLKNTEGILCLICKQGNETLSHFLSVCTSFCRHFDSLWADLVSKIKNSNPTDGAHMSHFIMNLNRHHKTLLLPECLPLPFDISTMTVITRLIAAAIGKFYKVRAEKLHELEAPWLSNSTSYVPFLFNLVYLKILLLFLQTFKSF